MDKEFKIKINGLEESVKYTKLLADSFLAVERNISRANFSISQLRQGIQKTWGASADLGFGIVKNFNEISSTVQAIHKTSAQYFASYKNKLADIKPLQTDISKGIFNWNKVLKEVNSTLKETTEGVSHLSKED